MGKDDRERPVSGCCDVSGFPIRIEFLFEATKTAEIIKALSAFEDKVADLRIEGRALGLSQPRERGHGEIELLIPVFFRPE